MRLRLRSLQSLQKHLKPRSHTHNPFKRRSIHTIAVAIQPSEAFVASEATQQAVVKDIKEDELRAVFEARGETAKEHADSWPPN